jgi:hypothetical protein
LQTEGEGTKKINFQRLLIYAIAALIVFVVAIWLSYTFLVWHINEYMYGNKLGLDWFDTIFYHWYAFVVPAIVALVVIFPYPKRSDLFSLLRESSKTVSRRNLAYGSDYVAGVVPREASTASRNIWIGWQLLKYLIAFGIAYSVQGFLFYPNVTEALMLNNYGFGSWSLVPRLFVLPIDQASGNDLVSFIPTMQAQYYLFMAAIGTVLLIIAIRLFLKLLRDLLSRPGNQWIIDILAFGITVSGSILLGGAYWSMNAATPYIYYVLLIIIAGFAFGIAYFRLSGKGLIPVTARRRTLTKVFAIALGIVFLVNIGTLGYIGVNWSNNWLSYQWTPQIQKEIAVTQYAAGLTSFNESSISSVPSGNISQILSVVRVWDDNASLIRSQSQIGVNYLDIPNAEIVYLKDNTTGVSQQYWVQPTTIKYPPGGQNWQSEHLIYTHADRLVVINANTGNYTSLSQALGQSPTPAIDDPLIYYGENAPSLGDFGFSNNVYVNVANEPAQIGNVTYSGTPDYVLSGGERSLWFFAGGPTTWGFAFSPPQASIEMLYNREVVSRVQSVLINGLVVDPSTYLVTDGTHLYYAMMVYIDYPLQTGFAQSYYLRNFAVVLVNVNDGTMHPYLVDNSSDFLSSFFEKYYQTWNQPPPAWLVPQLRYPLALLGAQQAPGQVSAAPGQLDADFIYHVTGSSIFKSGQDFYERPSATGVYYVLVNENNTLYYVGLQLGEFLNSPGKNLGGIYIAYGGSRLDQISLFQVNPNGNSTQKLIGPSAAVQAVDANAFIKTQLTLYGTEGVVGNILPYLIGSQLYYFIPIYVYIPQSSSSGNSGVIAKLAYVTVVDASNAAVGYGSTPTAAFLNLTNSTSIQTGSATTSTVSNAFTARGYAPVPASQVSFNVGFNVKQISLSNASPSSVNQSVTNFINGYVTPHAPTTVYEWTSGATTYFGILYSASGIVESDYISVTA